MKTLLPYLICIVLGLLLARECNKEKAPEIIVRTVTVKVPEIINHIDTIYKPIPKVIYKTDTIILKKFLSASDSLKIALYVDATKIREYKEQFKDSTQEVNVFTKVRGEMLAQSLDYKIFERIITHSDTIEIKKKRSLYLLPKLGTDFDSKIKASIGLTLIDKKNNLFSIDFDTDKVFSFGMGLKW